MVAVLLAGCGVPPEYQLRSEVKWTDGETIFNLLLNESRFKDVADRIEPFTVRVDIYHSQVKGGLVKHTNIAHDYTYMAGNVTQTTTDEPDFTLRTSQDVALAILNADDSFRVFACATKNYGVTFEANDMLRAASLNGAKSRIFKSATDCTADIGDAVTFRGLKGHLVDGKKIGEEYYAKNPNNLNHNGFPPLVARLSDNLLVFNTWRAPTMWLDPDLSKYCHTAFTDICGGVGTSVPSSALADCAAKVKEAYADEPAAEGWSAGQAAARASNKAAEEAMCQLFFGGL